MRMRANRHAATTIAFAAFVIGSGHASRAPAADLSFSDIPAADEELARLEFAPPAGVPLESIITARYYLQLAEDLRNRTAEGSRRFLDLAGDMIDAIRTGADPLAGKRGLVVRGYRSRLSTKLQGYSVYLSESFDPSASHPMVVILHGGSSNHHLFLWVVLGNNVVWATYSANLWTRYEARWDPGDFVLMAPNGFGQVMWRWMGERDVLDAIDDAARAYSIDRDRIFLNGVSNGGVGTYTIGWRHAWRFAGVVPMAGAPGWRQYAGVGLRDWERPLLQGVSAYDLAINAQNTRVHIYHGDRDGGPMKPEFVAAFERRLREIDAPFDSTHYDLGHDIIYAVHRRGAFLHDLRPIRRNRRPERIRLAAADYRAARQHWVEVAEFEEYPAMATVEARLADGTLDVTTSNVMRLRLYLEDIPVPEGGVDLVVDGRRVLRLPPVRHVVPFVIERAAGTWRPAAYGPEPGLRKTPGLAGPLTDAFLEPVVHVYGTGVPEETDDLRGAATRACHNWTFWIWDHDQRVIADTDVTDRDIRDATLVLFGTIADNSILRRIAPHLPIGLGEEGIRVGEHVFAGRDAGVRMIYPNPLNPSRYVVVQSGNTASAAVAGNGLPDFLPDYVVYDSNTVRTRERLVFGRRSPLAAGFFDSRWRLPEGAGAPPAPARP